MPFALVARLAKMFYVECGRECLTLLNLSFEGLGVYLCNCMNRNVIYKVHTNQSLYLMEG
jgi:hypothetical protein